ncbi:unnamed protein product [Rangifer tarandus platyrhynchus]|uniref:Uncharacterized protein n=1 Tax=Rangifer tarandus platyrhynchus TaxID=3082113 RepID=A0AC59ZQE6_RANTA
MPSLATWPGRQGYRTLRTKEHGHHFRGAAHTAFSRVHKVAQLCRPAAQAPATPEPSLQPLGLEGTSVQDGKLVGPASPPLATLPEGCSQLGWGLNPTPPPPQPAHPSPASSRGHPVTGTEDCVAVLPATTLWTPRDESRSSSGDAAQGSHGTGSAPAVQEPRRAIPSFH